MMEESSSSSGTTPSTQRNGRKRLRRRSSRKCPELRRSGRRRRKVDLLKPPVSSLSTSTSSSSSDSENDGRARSKRPRSHALDLLKTPVGKGTRKTMDEIQHISVDKSLTFNSVGGLQTHINKLKEMVIFPLLYKEFYVNRSITPPRGVLFHGPPGTGKTLLARALASEASCVGGREVTIFVRKGADILNKWIGESERHLKLLFEQAVFKQPSIIFFDEIDGLAPMRSSKTDQIHNSVVSTLLAEMDGLKTRGDVVVIGATNRIDTLDPALRRPGRFDLEFQFLLPSYQGRRDIFDINLSTWNPPVSSEMTDDLALLTVGYSGADIKLLCAEASVCALRRRYPQIYRSNQKFVLDYESIKVTHCDWEEAMKIVGRSADRSIFSSFFAPLPLPQPLNALLSKSVDEVQEKVKELFPYKSKIIYQPSGRALLIDLGVDHDVLQHVISASLWDSLDGVPIHVLTVPALATKGNSVDDGSAVAFFFAEVKRAKAPSVVYIPYLDHFVDSLSSPARLVFDQEMNSVSFHPILIIAFCENDCLQPELKSRFLELHLSPIGTNERCDFFRDIFSNVTCIKAEPVVLAEEELEVAPPEPVQVNPEQLAWIERQESRTMRELRAFLREVIFKLLRRKKFAPFSKPVDPTEVPDYLNVISKPMDLEKMMIKVTNGEYHSARDFLADINLIANNCLEYNPTVTQEDRELRCTAIELKDVAKSIIDREMDSDFEDHCIKITEKRKARSLDTDNKLGEKAVGKYDHNERSCDNALQSPNVNIFSPTSSTPGRRRGHVRKKKASAWAKGSIGKRAKQSLTNRKVFSGPSVINGGVPHTPTVKPRTRQSSTCDSVLGMSEGSNQCLDKDMQQEQKPKRRAGSISSKKQEGEGPQPIPDANGFIPCPGSTPGYKEYKTEAQKMFEICVRGTLHYRIRQLLDLRFKILSLVDQYGTVEEKPTLIIQLKRLINACRMHQGRESREP